MLTWIEALKKFNAGSAKYVVPKKGTADYNAVKRMMGGEEKVAPKEEKMKKPMKRAVKINSASNI